MIEKIGRDVSNKLNATISWDFEDMVGIEAHLQKMQSLLHLDNEDGSMIIGICGPAGIGKTTIARALHSRLSSNFQLTCFMENVRRSYNSDLDEYGSKLCLQEKLGNVYIMWIFCRNAFKQSSAPDGFEKLAESVTKLCSNLPLGLCVMGSSLQRKGGDDWECILHRLENSLDRKIEGVLRVGYENLHKDDQLLFLLIAFFFNYEDDNHMKEMLGDCNLDVRLGLKNLKSKSLIQISTEGEIVMHKLLEQVGREVVQRQDPRKRQILTDADDIFDVLENNSDGRHVIGISFDISTLPNDVYLSAIALKKMRNLRFLKIYKTRWDTNNRVHLPENMEFPFQLRLLDWEVYPGKCLPLTFKPQNLVELNLTFNKLEKLWEGSQPLANLKKMNLKASVFLKELPDLSIATNLERLYLGSCYSLEEIPSYIGNLHKLEVLKMTYCINVQVLPAHFDLASINGVNLKGCWQLRKLPDISTNIYGLEVSDTMVEELLGSIRLWSHLTVLHIYGSFDPYLPPDVVGPHQKRSGADIEKIPDSIKDLHGLKYLEIYGCPKLTSLPEFPRSLETLMVNTCESLETIIAFPPDSQIKKLYFTNCLKLGEEAQKIIIQQSKWACLPGRNIPAEFHHRAIGNSLTIPLEITSYRICVMFSPKQQMIKDAAALWFRLSVNGVVLGEDELYEVPNVKTEHLYIYHFDLPFGEVLWEFSNPSQDIEIIECGFQVLTKQTGGSSSNQESYESRSEQPGKLLILTDGSTSDHEMYEFKSEQVFDSSKPLMAWLPGRTIPTELFHHRAIGNSLIIPSNADDFRICLAISPKQKMVENVGLMCRLSRGDGTFLGELELDQFSNVETEHLYVKRFQFPKVDHEVLWEFNTSSPDIDIIECGLEILTDQTKGPRKKYLLLLCLISAVVFFYFSYRYTGKQVEMLY